MPAHATENLHPSIPRVLCPQCLTYMRLAKIEPDPNNAQITMMSFDCACGFVYQQSERTTEDDEAA